MLERYANLYPEAPEIIFESFRKQVDHRLKIEEMALVSNANRSTEGLRLGFVITMFCLVLGGFLIMNGHDQAGVAIIAIDLVALAGIFVYGSQQQGEERKRKTEAMVEALRGRRIPERSTGKPDGTESRQTDRPEQA